MKCVEINTLLPRITPHLPGCNDTMAKIALADAARTFARESDIIIETRGFVQDEAPAYGRMPEFALDPDNFLPLHFIARKDDQKIKRVYVTYSLLPIGNLIPESVVNRYHEAITSQALFMLCSMPGKPWTSGDMAQLNLQKYRIALGDAMRDNQSAGAVFDQYMLCCEPGDTGFVGAQNVTATVIGTDTSDGNITPAVVLAGYKGYAKGEMIVGEVPAMPQPTVSENVVTVYAGFNQTARVVTIPEAGALTVAKNKVTVPVGYIKSQRIAEIPVKTATLSENTVTIPEGYNNGQSLSVPVVSAVNDGEFVTVPVGYIRVEQKFKVAGGVELDFVTATANDILAGKVGADKDGHPVHGNIQTVTASKSGNVVTVPKGYIATAQTLTIDAAKSATVSGNVVTIYPGYTASQYTATVPKATSSVSGNVVTIPAGYHDAKTLTVAEAGQVTVNNNVVTIPVGYNKARLEISVGTAKSASTITPGTADQIIPADTYLTGDLTVKGDADLIAENIAEGKEIFGVAGSFKGGGGMDFYKCAAVYGPRTVTRIRVEGAGTAKANGDYVDSGKTNEGNPVYTNGECFLYRYYEMYGITDLPDYYGEAEALYYRYDSIEGEWNSNMGAPPTPTVSEVTVTLDAGVPKTWDGYKAVFDGSFYSYEETLTTGLSYGNAFTPRVGYVYTADCSAMLGKLYAAFPIADALFAIDASKGLNDLISGNAPTLYGSGTVLQNGEFCFDSQRGLDYIIGESMSNLAEFTIEMDYTITSDATGFLGFFGNKRSWSAMCVCMQWGRNGYRPAMFWNDYFDTNAGGPEHPEWVNDGVYHHVAMVKKGEVVTLYSDGVAISSYSGATKALNLAIENTLAVGVQHVENQILPGRMKHFRVLGYAEYDGNFNVPDWVGI